MVDAGKGQTATGIKHRLGSATERCVILIEVWSCGGFDLLHCAIVQLRLRITRELAEIEAARILFGIVKFSVTNQLRETRGRKSHTISTDWITGHFVSIKAGPLYIYNNNNNRKNRTCNAGPYQISTGSKVRGSKVLARGMSADELRSVFPCLRKTALALFRASIANQFGTQWHPPNALLDKFGHLDFFRDLAASRRHQPRGIHRKMPRHSLIGWIKFGEAGAANWNGHIDGQDHKDTDKAAKSAGQTALLSEPERVSASVRAHAKKKMIVLSDEEMEEKSCCVPNCTMTEPNLPMVACSGPACDSQVHLCCVGSKAKDNIPPPEWFCDDDYGNA
ncbi:hypothetical protein DFH07DRAFT_779119 [Mycena maculata]|uniref:Uncharacterized protein n=1 Tax=Mycena maculata TaxID=230809 RepID=A0AAD7IB34_9AGAR|nr:hypothetical protein DFH07DRAFT_779119 [Mycena maculata]